MRLLRLDRAQVDDSTGEVFDNFQKERGKVPNMFRTMAQRPELMRTAAAHMRALMTTGTVSPKLKELVIVRTSQLNHCEY